MGRALGANDDLTLLFETAKRIRYVQGLAYLCAHMGTMLLLFLILAAAARFVFFYVSEVRVGLFHYPAQVR
jgi:hypothetical protein